MVNHDVGKLGPIVGAVQEDWGRKPPTQTLIGSRAWPRPTCCSRSSPRHPTLMYRRRPPRPGLFDPAQASVQERGSHAEQNTAITAYVRCTTSGPIQGRLRHRLTHPEMD